MGFFFFAFFFLEGGEPTACKLINTYRVLVFLVLQLTTRKIDFLHIYKTQFATLIKCGWTIRQIRGLL